MKVVNGTSLTVGRRLAAEPHKKKSFGKARSKKILMECSPGKNASQQQTSMKKRKP